MSREQSFLALYVEYRFRDQRRYYQNRRDEFQAAQQQANLIAGALMVLAAAASAAAGASAGPKAWWAVLAAALPAIAGLGQAMQRLFAYERLAKLYDDAAHALADADSEPNLSGKGDAEAAKELNVYVTKVERIFRKEQGQWGQLTAELKLENPRRSKT